MHGHLAGAYLLIDVRESAEHAEGHADGAALIPLSRADFIEAVFDAAGGDANRAIALMCRTGARSSRAASQLAPAGFTDLKIVAGGFLAWRKAGLPVARG